MADKQLPEEPLKLSRERLEAGADFLDALRKLGLDPEGLLWAYDTSMEEFVVVLVTSFYDQVGPLAINRLLFKAYNIAATPKSISPFIVQLHSPNDDVSVFLADFVRNAKGKILQMRDSGRPERVSSWELGKPIVSHPDFAIRGIGVPGTDLCLLGDGFYAWKEKPPSPAARVGLWTNFVRNVEALAA